LLVALEFRVHEQQDGLRMDFGERTETIVNQREVRLKRSLLSFNHRSLKISELILIVKIANQLMLT
tara:strand:- start:312 stop:509 length:198 start_codon:yes stop_codon:yes gene_type:complete